MEIPPTAAALDLPPLSQRLVRLSVRAGEVFANRDTALAWLGTPNPSLQWQTPIGAARTEDGFKKADDALTRIEFGVLG